MIMLKNYLQNELNEILDEFLVIDMLSYFKKQL